MNKKGQVLVLFVILIPIFVVLAAFVIDVSYNMYHSNRLHSVNEMVIRYGLKHIKEEDVRTKMIDLLYKNINNIDSYELVIKDNMISLKINKTVDSVFGKAINIDFYYISSEYNGYIDKDKIRIEKG